MKLSHLSSRSFLFLILSLSLHLCLSAFIGGSTLLLFSAPAAAQSTPTLDIDDDIRAFAFAPDGRLVYAVRHLMKVRRLELQRDDVWLLASDGKRRRIVNGEKLIKGPAAFSYSIQSLTFSPDGSRLTADLRTVVLTDERGDTQEGQLTLLLDDSGKEIKISGADSVIPGATHAAWLADGVTVVYLTEDAKPGLLFSIGSVRPVAGRGGSLFDGRFFTAVAWDAKRNSAVAIERDRSLAGPPRLVVLDLLKESRREIATLENYIGGLTVSPTGAKAAYFTDPDTLVIRELAAPGRIARLRIALGNYEWTPDERRILIKRGSEKRSGDLVWVTLPSLTTIAPGTSGPPPQEAPLEPALHGLTFRDFALSPDGRQLAVLQPGNRHLLIYPLP